MSSSGIKRNLKKKVLFKEATTHKSIIEKKADTPVKYSTIKIKNLIICRHKINNNFRKRHRIFMKYE